MLAVATGEGTSGEQTVPEMEQRHKNEPRPEEPQFSIAAEGQKEAL